MVCELARHTPQDYLSLAPQLFHLLTSSSNNWMLIKIIKLVRLLCCALFIFLMSKFSSAHYPHMNPAWSRNSNHPSPSSFRQPLPFHCYMNAYIRVSLGACFKDRQAIRLQKSACRSWQPSFRMQIKTVSFARYYPFTSGVAHDSASEVYSPTGNGKNRSQPSASISRISRHLPF